MNNENGKSKGEPTIAKEEEERTEEFQLLFHVTSEMEEDETLESLKEEIKKERRSLEKYLEKHSYIKVAEVEECFESDGEFIFKPKEGKPIDDGSSVPSCTCGGLYLTPSRHRACSKCGAKDQREQE